MTIKNNKIIKFKTNDKWSIDDIIIQLNNFCYERKNEIDIPGTFSVKGGNISIFSTNNHNPIRLDFFGNVIESIYFYNQKTGKKIKKISLVEIFSNILFLSDGTKVKPDDYVVHEDHGIGIFSNSETKIINGKTYLYITIKYLNNDCLYIPEELKDKISPYIGIGRKKPKINKLGSQVWKKNYKKTYENIILFARKLISLYAEREIIKSKGWKIDCIWNNKIKENFGYVETRDQEKVISEVFSDLEKNIPMERLIVGDVGFGKTEVAIRAATQACANGFQTAILVPTTILAEQHYVNLKQRFNKLPVIVGHLSRLVNKKNQTEVISKIEDGTIDVVVGTHKLFHQNIKYKNLGLLIIDEEQKFGVKDKEKLKETKKEVNVLTMTATPIPRTLFMSLSGIRDISQIYSPPAGRKEIFTSMKKYDNEEIKKYIKREIDRKGQIYFLHNRVETIENCRQKLQKMVPNVKIAVAHGQMGELALAKTMRDFSSRKIDLLVCSTIIENGIDLPFVNTLIVDNADRFGLSQLYQIRGRIGRSKLQAYALFLHNENQLTNNAFKRFQALLDNTALGSGYNIAISDLEIRGGGNILGREQHGNMESIGLVLYSKLLNKAVKKLTLI